MVSVGVVGVVWRFAGAANQTVVVGGGCQRIGGVCGCAGPRVGGQPDGAGSARSWLRALVNWVAHGQLVGRCRVRVRPLVVIRPATAKRRRRIVLATLGLWLVVPRLTLQRIRLCATVANTAHAALAWNTPEGQWLSPAPSFRSR